MPDPIADTKRAELGEIAVVKNQNEMSRLATQTLEHVSVSTWKVPDVACLKIVRFSLTSWINDRCTNAAFENERPFRSSGVPVKFAHRAGFKLHRYTSNSLGDRQLLDGRFLSEAVSENFPVRFLQFELETRQFFPREQRIRYVISKG